jgi:hypothetical protein
MREYMSDKLAGVLRQPALDGLDGISSVAPPAPGDASEEIVSCDSLTSLRAAQSKPVKSGGKARRKEGRSTCLRRQRQLEPRDADTHVLQVTLTPHPLTPAPHPSILTPHTHASTPREHSAKANIML